MTGVKDLYSKRTSFQQFGVTKERHRWPCDAGDVHLGRHGMFWIFFFLVDLWWSSIRLSWLAMKRLMFDVVHKPKPLWVVVHV